MTFKNQTCCFTGHRSLPADRIELIIKRLNAELDKLIHRGVTDFISGGALGFDQIAASLVIAKRQMGRNIRLLLALPCREQDAAWSPAQKQLYRKLLSNADEVVYVSEKYTDGCMKKRNRYLVEHSAHCICALIHPRSGTSQTVNMARAQGLNVINIAT